MMMMPFGEASVLRSIPDDRKKMSDGNALMVAKASGPLEHFHLFEAQ
jgi:hypothetical protein